MSLAVLQTEAVHTNNYIVIGLERERQRQRDRDRETISIAQ